MKTGNYSILDILEFQNLDQLIIPEIQRDYVWKANDVIHLLDSIREGFEEDSGEKPYLGFIYAYTDRDYVYKYFLIDGQQRMTSIFLLFLACYQKMGKTLPSYLFKQNKIKLDYKVRQATHDFLTDFVNHCHKNPEDCNFKIENQVWYYKSYENDRTIFNIIQNYYAIKEWLNCIGQEELPIFLRYLEDEVELSYFNVDSGREGEDLYIYMNSRGRQLEENETLKAKFLSKVETENKNHWGEKWEYWQDFFWKNRGESPDADFGFINFLKKLQIINMCKLGKSTNDISLFASGRSNEKLNFDLLPNTLGEIKDYFEAYKWLIESVDTVAFFSKYKNFDVLSTYEDHSQVDYLRLLPILIFLKETGCRDTEAIIRFIRFFYNVSRKENVRKDIATQLPISLKFMLEYSTEKNENFDVCDFIHYQQGRTFLIDEEEIQKLNLYLSPPPGVRREEIEALFWDSEDHFIFMGEIKFLLDEYFDNESCKFNLTQYKNSWFSIKTLFPEKVNPNDQMITKTLLFYGNTWVQDTPYYYTNYNCQAWHTLVRKKPKRYLLELLEDMHKKDIEYLDVIFKQKAKQYFELNKLTSIEALKSEKTLFGQVRILSTIDYYCENKIWQKYAYIANDERYTYTGDMPFFNRNKTIHNVLRYIYEGFSGRIIPMLSAVLNDDQILEQKITEILKGV